MIYHILKLLPEFSEYRESFVGGGAVFANVKLLKPKTKFWINDLDYDLYCFYKSLRDNTHYFLSTLDVLNKKVLGLKDFWGDIEKLRKFSYVVYLTSRYHHSW